MDPLVIAPGGEDSYSFFLTMKESFHMFFYSPWMTSRKWVSTTTLVEIQITMFTKWEKEALLDSLVDDFIGIGTGVQVNQAKALISLNSRISYKTKPHTKREKYVLVLWDKYIFSKAINSVPNLTDRYLQILMEELSRALSFSSEYYSAVPMGPVGNKLHLFV